MAWLSVALGTPSQESQQGSRKPRPGLGGRVSCPLAYSPLIHPMGFWLKSCRGIQQPPSTTYSQKEKGGLISIS